MIKRFLNFIIFPWTEKILFSVTIPACRRACTALRQISPGQRRFPQGGKLALPSNWGLQTFGYAAIRFAGQDAKPFPGLYGELVTAPNFVLTKNFERFIVAVIIVNAIILGMETSPYLVTNYGKFLTFADQACLAIFTVEIILKIFCLKASYIKNPWNIFDFVIVSISLISATGGFSVLRSLRVLRVLLLVSTLNRLRTLVRALVISLPNIASITLLLLLIYYVSAVIATKLFGHEFPQWFGNLGESFFTLFQLMTLESWAMGSVRPVCEHFPYATMFFIPFILLSAFIIMNLFIAIIINATTESREQEIKKQEQGEMEAEQAAQLEEEDKFLLVCEQLKLLNESVNEIKSQLANPEER